MKFPTKIPNRKTKTKTGKGGITPSNLNESIEILKLDSSISEGKGNISSPQFQAFNLQKAAAGIWECLFLRCIWRTINKLFIFFFFYYYCK